MSIETCPVCGAPEEGVHADECPVSRLVDGRRACCGVPAGRPHTGDCTRRLATSFPHTHDTEWFCDTAKQIIGGGGQHRQDYGDALESFEAIAKMWSVILGVEVTAEKVAMCQLTLKMGRLLNTPNHTDSWVDIIGYAALGGDISHRPGRHA